MSPERTILHLVRKGRGPAELGDPGPNDAVVSLSDDPSGARPTARTYVLSPGGSGQASVSMEGLVDLIFEHDVVVTW